MKKEVTWEDLNEALADKTLNLDHEFVQYILHKPRQTLCIVYETVATSSEPGLDLDALNEGDASVSAGKPTFSINLSGSVQAACHRSFELPNNTILGYACYEVTFDTVEGSFELVIPDTTDADWVEGSRKQHMFDEPDGQKDKALTAVFDDLLKSSLCSKIVEIYRKILAYPEAIAPLRDMLEEALSSSKDKSLKPLMLSEFKTGVGSGYESCKELLLLLGLKVEEAEQGSITVSKDSRVGLLHCCTAPAEAIVELSAQQCKA